MNKLYEYTMEPRPFSHPIQTFQLVFPEQEIFRFCMSIQGVRGQSVFFNLALRERNIQVRLYLKVVLKF